MDYVFIVSAHSSDGSVESFIALPEFIGEFLESWCIKYSYLCVVHSYKLGSLSLEEFMVWDVHNLSEFDIVQFEFEYDVSLFN